MFYVKEPYIECGLPFPMLLCSVLGVIGIGFPSIRCLLGNAYSMLDLLYCWKGHFGKSDNS